MPAEPLKPSHSAGMFSLSLGAEPVYRLGPLRGEAELGDREVELASLPELTLLGGPALDILFACSEVGEGCGPQFYKGAPVGLGIELDCREIVGTHLEIAETGLAHTRREGPGQRLVGGVSVPGGVDALPALAIGALHRERAPVDIPDQCPAAGFDRAEDLAQGCCRVGYVLEHL